jgi:hypothetical protein
MQKFVFRLGITTKSDFVFARPRPQADIMPRTKKVRGIDFPKLDNRSNGYAKSE